MRFRDDHDKAYRPVAPEATDHPIRGTPNMKLRLAFASLLVLPACGTSQEAIQALQTMQILENNTAEGISYEKLSGSGNDVTLTGGSFMAPGEVMAAMAPPAALEDGSDASASMPAAAPTGPVAVAQADTLKF